MQHNKQDQEPMITYPQLAEIIARRLLNDNHTVRVVDQASKDFARGILRLATGATSTAPWIAPLHDVMMLLRKFFPGEV